MTNTDIQNHSWQTYQKGDEVWAGRHRSNPTNERTYYEIN
jgi:hypothetical protein